MGSDIANKKAKSPAYYSVSKNTLQQTHRVCEPQLSYLDANAGVLLPLSDNASVGELKTVPSFMRQTSIQEAKNNMGQVK
jgi:hypothetical protein